MDVSSPSPRRPARRLRSVVEITLLAVVSVGVGMGIGWLGVTVIRIAVDFVVAFRSWLTGVAVVAIAVIVFTFVARAKAAYEADLRERRLREIAHLDQVDGMTGTQFENLIAELLRRDGLRGVQVIGKSGDQGVDVIATTPHGRKLAIQCKRQNQTVRADRIRNLIGAVHCAYAGYQGVLITSNRFTAPAAEEGRQGQIIMIDRDTLARWMDGQEGGNLFA